MKKVILFYLCVSVILLSGCGLIFKKETKVASPLEPQAILKFSDIPVPTGFKLMDTDSYAFENYGMRVGVLRYRGKADVEQVINFYKEQMPMYNWRLLNMMEYGERLMNFERETETCNIGLIIKYTPLIGNTVFITITVGAKSTLPAAKKLK